MSEAVSQGFLDVWGRKNGKEGIITILFKRRYWDGSAYVYEADWTELPMNKFVDVGEINWKLDVPLLNTVKTSNVALKLKNQHFEWLPTNNTNGYFRTTLTRPYGFNPFLTKFQIKFGYKLDDDTFESVNLFTGVAVDFIFNTKDGYVEVDVSGNEYLLQKYDAQLVSIEVLNAATTGGPRVFTTVQPSIGVIKNVYDDGVLLDLGVDYNVNSKSVFGVGAEIELTYDAVGAVTYDGRYWYTNVRLEDAVNSIIAAAGVSASANVSAVVWPGAPATTSEVIGAFSGTAYSPTWTVLQSNGAGVSAASGKLIVDSDGATIAPTTVYAAQMATNSKGLWQWDTDDVAVGTGLQYPNGVRMFFFMDGVGLVGGDSRPSGNGYCLSLAYVGASTFVVFLIKTSGGTDTIINSATFAFSLSGTNTWQVTRSSSGLFNVLYNGNLILSGVDNTYPTNGYFIVDNRGQSGSEANCTVSNIQWQDAITLTMADFTGQTCYDAVQALAKLADFVWGFDRTGNFFFTPKTLTPAPVAAVSQSDGISEVMDFRPGYDEIVNVAQVSYQENQEEFNSETAGETGQTSQLAYLNQIDSESYDLLLINDNNIANGRAQLLYQNRSQPRRRVRWAGKIIPFAELLDIITFSYYNNPIEVDMVAGDPMRKFGFGIGGKSLAVLARDMPAKLRSIIERPLSGTAEYEGQEVL